MRLHHNARRQVCELGGAVRLVDFLAARSGAFKVAVCYLGGGERWPWRQGCRGGLLGWDWGCAEEDGGGRRRECRGFESSRITKARGED